MKFIHIADVHLGAAPDAGMPWAAEREQEIWDGFDRLLERAQEEKADLLLIAGDLFHRQPLMRELKELNYKFERLKPMKVVMMAGNHDYLRQGSHYQTMRWASNVGFFRSTEPQCFYFDDLKTYVYGLSYTNYEMTESVYDGLRPVKKDGCHILLAHGGDAKHVPINMPQLGAAGFDYVALGHIHKPQMLQGGRMAYAGALQPVDKNDTGDHGFVLGEWTDGKMSAQFVPFSERAYIHTTIQMDGSMPWEMVLDFVRSEMSRLGPQHIYKVTLTGFRDPDLEIVPQDLMRLGQIVEVVDETRPDYDFDAIYARNKDNMIGMFIERIRSIPAEEASREKALYYGLRALFQTMQ